MTEQKVPVRLVWRADQNMIRLWPGVIEKPCSRCGKTCILDSNQPDPYGGSVLVCVPCALGDPEMRPEVLKIYADVQKNLRR